MGTDQQLFEQLSKLRNSRTLIVGMGNVLKGDDGAGPFICEQLQQSDIRVEVINAGTVPENYIQQIIKKAPRNLLIIDAIDFGAEPGTIKTFKPAQLESTVTSTHTLSPHLFVDMVGQSIKVNVYFVGIQPANIRLGDSMSPQVRQAARQLAQMLIDVFPSDTVGPVTC